MVVMSTGRYGGDTWLTYEQVHVVCACMPSPRALGVLPCPLPVPTCCSGASGASCSCPPGTGRLGCSLPASQHPAGLAVYSGPSPFSPFGPLAQGPTDLQARGVTVTDALAVHITMPEADTTRDRWESGKAAFTEWRPFW